MSQTTNANTKVLEAVSPARAQRGLPFRSDVPDRGTDQRPAGIRVQLSTGSLEWEEMDDQTRRQTARQIEAQKRQSDVVLRDYQRNCLDAIASGHETCDSVCVELATGTGKTIIFCRYAATQKFGRTLIVCPQLTLIRQAAAKILDETGLSPAIEQASLWSEEHIKSIRNPYIVASKQTLTKKVKSGRPRYARFKDVGLVVIDECHYAGTQAYREMVSWFRSQGAKILGVSATVQRTDKRAMSEIFDKCVFQYGIRQACDDGWLVRPRVRCKQIQSLDLTDVKTGNTFSGRDFNSRQLDEKLSNPAVVYEIAEAIAQETRGKRTAIYCASVNEAQAVAELLTDNYGIAAAWVCADERRVPKANWVSIMDRFSAGDITHVCNVGQLTTGWDLPALEAIVMARPTQSRVLYTQVMGRGTRPLPGVVDFDGSTPSTRQERIAESRKPHFSVVDLVDNSLNHKIVTVADVLSGEVSADVAARVRTATLERSVDIDAATLAAKWEQEVEANSRISELKLVCGRQQLNPPTDEQTLRVL